MSRQSRSAVVEAKQGARGRAPRAHLEAAADGAPLAVLSFGRVDGRPVFMDLQTDLYFLAQGEEERHLLATAEHASGPVPTTSLESEQRIAPKLRDVAAVLRLLVRSRREVRTAPIGAAVIGSAGAGRASADGSTIAAITERFITARRLIPLAPRCLPDCLALVEWLARHGCSSTLVFGVKLDPFAAHCWVQSGALLLSDRLEEVERFTPVRIVRCAPAMR